MSATPTPIPIAPPDTACVGCGYGVGLMPADGLCPECATPVATSLRGDLLRHANPDYVRTIARGLLLVIIGSAVTMSWWVITPVTMAALVPNKLLSFAEAFLLIQATDFLGAVLMLVGWWWVSTPNPAVQDPIRDVRSRRLLRGLLCLIAAITGIGFVGVAVPAFAAAGLSGISGNIYIDASTRIPPVLILAMALRLTLVLARTLRFFVGLTYLRTLALRIPDRELERAAKRQLWLFPLSMTVGWAAIVGPLVGVYLYFALLFRFLRAVTRAGRRR